MLGQLRNLHNWREERESQCNLRIALENIREANPTVNAFCEVYESEALACAQMQTNIFKEKRKALEGLIFGIKDLFCYSAHKVQAGSKMLENYISPFSATVVERVLAAGGLIIGRQNCDEFGMGNSNKYSVYGPARNVIDPQRTSGGSSGGSAVAVQGNMCHVSFGTDTGGSIRQPASFCGIIGFKPSYGHISRYGVIAHASSFDTVGILAKDIDDVISVYDVVVGEDGKDLSMDYIDEQPEEKEKYKIGVFRDCINLGCLQEEVRDAISKTCERLEEKGCALSDVRSELFAKSVPAYYVLTSTEASSNLARYDGVRYGYASVHDKDYEQLITSIRTEGFGKEVKRRIMLANYIFMSEKEKKFREKALLVRENIKKEMKNLFCDHDFLILPTTPTTAFYVNDNSRENAVTFWEDSFTSFASLAQIPAISVPCGYDKNGMPIGIQILSHRHGDRGLLKFVKNFLEVIKG